MSDREVLQRFYDSIGSVLKSSNVELEKQPATVIKSVNVEEQKCVEIVYAPDVKDVHQQWMTPATIKKGVESFSNNDVGSNLFHLVETDQFEITNSWIVEEDTDYEVNDETTTVVAGTWLAETHYTDDTLWGMKKSGELGGLSLGGYGDVNSETGEITNLCFSKEEYQQLTKEAS